MGTIVKETMYRLEYHLDEDQPDGRKESIVVTRENVLLGTDPDSDILLDAGSPCRVIISEARNGQVTIRDLDDRPSIELNEHMTMIAELSDKDQVRIGNAEFRFMRIIPPQTLVSRSRSILEHCSTAAVWGVMAAQMIFLCWVLIFWRIGGIDTAVAATGEAPPVEVAQAPDRVTVGDPSKLKRVSAPPAEPAPTSSEPTAIPVPEPTAIPVPVPKVIPVPEPKVIPAPEPTAIPAPEPTAIPVQEPKVIPAPGPTAIPVPVPTAIPVPEPKVAAVPAPKPIPVPAPRKIPVPTPKPIPVPEPKVVSVPVQPTVPVAPTATPAVAAMPKPAQVVIDKNEPSILPANLRDPSMKPRPSTAVNPAAVETPPAPEIDQTSAVVEQKPRVSLEENLLDSAVKQANLGNFERADTYLEQIQRIDEHFLPSYAERARLFEKRKMYSDAIKQWRSLSDRGVNTTWQEIADGEVNRLQKISELVVTSKKMDVASAPQPAVLGGPLLEIETAEIKRLGSGENYDDMRILNIEVGLTERVKQLSGNDIRIRIHFFDQDRKTRQIAPTEVPTPNTDFTLTGLLSNKEPLTVTRPYIVPKDFRRKQFERDGALMTYYGFTVELYLRDQLQERLAQPITLISKEY
jgi:hypothetical protein